PARPPTAGFRASSATFFFSEQPWNSPGNTAVPALAMAKERARVSRRAYSGILSSWPETIQASAAGPPPLVSPAVWSCPHARGVCLGRPHAQQQVVGEAQRAGAGPTGLPLEGVGERDGEECGLARGEQQGRLSEVVARCRFRAEDAGSPL